MPKNTFPVEVTPDVLVWARESIGISINDVSEKLKLKTINKETVVAWESGKANPSYAQLKKLANIYRRPVSIFFLSSPPQKPLLPKDFRSLPGRKGEPLSQNSLLTIRKVRRIQSLSVTLQEILGLKKAILPVIRMPNYKNIAEKVRYELGIDIKTQFGFKSVRESLQSWIEAIQSTKVLVSLIAMRNQEIRGFSLTGKSSVIAINNKDSYAGKTFSLFHEYCHLMLRQSGICDMEELSKDNSYEAQVEQFCNLFAGEFLVPEYYLLTHKLVKTKRKSIEWDDEVLMLLAKDFKVSKEVILRRLLILGKTTVSFYQKKREEWTRNRKEYKPFGINMPVKKCIRENSSLFTSYVFDAYYQQFITYRDIANYLNVHTKYIPEIEQSMRKNFKI